MKRRDVLKKAGAGLAVTIAASGTVSAEKLANKDIRFIPEDADTSGVECDEGCYEYCPKSGGCYCIC